MPKGTDGDKKISLTQKMLAEAGVITLVAAAAYAIYNMTTAGAGGPSELTLHPERQDEINAERKAEALRDALNLTTEQTAQMADIFYRHRKELQTSEALGGNSDFASRVLIRLNARQARDEEIMALLDEEQQAIYAQTQLDRFDKFRQLRGMVQRGEVKPLLPDGQRPRIFDQLTAE